jgi:N-formylmethionyl-tRNA deformylase
MATLKILIFPDPKLRTVAEPVKEVDDSIVKLSKDMLETMYDGDGIGLAATQVDVHKRVIVVDVSNEKKIL